MLVASIPISLAWVDSVAKVSRTVHSTDDALEGMRRDVGREGDRGKFTKSDAEVREKEVKMSADGAGVDGKEAGQHLQLRHLAEPVEDQKQLDLGLQNGLLVGSVGRREDGA